LKAGRRSYAEELKYVAHIKSDALVRAFAKVPREKFLGPGPWRIPWGKEHWTTENDDPKHVYHNVLVAIDPVRHLNNGQPGFLAFLTRSKRANRQLKAAFQSGAQHAVRSLRRDRHKPNRTCWLHGADFCLSRTAVSDGTNPEARGSAGARRS
jgi:hypothetical protein